jgi:hypothetical protein
MRAQRSQLRRGGARSAANPAQMGRKPPFGEPRSEAFGRARPGDGRHRRGVADVTFPYLCAFDVGESADPHSEQPATWVTLLTGDMGNTFLVLFSSVVAAVGTVDPVGNAQRCPHVHRRAALVCAGDRRHGR